MKKISFGLLTFILVLACSTPKSIQESVLNDSYKIIESNLYFLASDELEGRETASQGERIAGQFIASQLKQYGVKPFGDNGTYFQNFELQKSEFLPSSNITLIKDEGRVVLKLGEGFFPYTKGDPIDEADMVFVGYGISDSSVDYNDYDGLDVTGKVVVAISGAPTREDDPDFTKVVSKYSRSTAKAKIAASKGAKGFITVLSTRWANRWGRLANRFLGSSIGKKSDPGQQINIVLIDTLTSKNLFSLPNLSYSALFDTLSAGYIKSGTLLDTKVSMKIEKDVESVVAKNVVGIVEGNNPALTNEIITVGAHYDHEGIRNGQVYNGADDNASGTAAILESARQISALRTNQRPIVYIFYTGEEKGLLGAEYFANNSEHIDNIIVNLNMDMVGRESEDTMYVVGSGKISSELYDIVEQANNETTKFHFDYTYDDEGHPERIYYRSDHYKFAEKGIPIAFLTDMHKADYHKPTDTADKINYKKVEKAAHLTTHIALKVANLDHKLTRDKITLSEK